MVVFPEKRLAHLGDLFPGKAAPVIDTANGGSAVEFPTRSRESVAELKDVARVTTGHDEAIAVMGQDAGLGDLREPANDDAGATFRNTPTSTNDFLEAVRQAMAAGKTAATRSRASSFPTATRLRHGEARANVRAIYRELGK